jgi:hypothetical protein
MDEKTFKERMFEVSRQTAGIQVRDINGQPTVSVRLNNTVYNPLTQGLDIAVAMLTICEQQLRDAVAVLQAARQYNDENAAEPVLAFLGEVRFFGLVTDLERLAKGSASARNFESLKDSLLRGYTTMRWWMPDTDVILTPVIEGFEEPKPEEPEEGAGVKAADAVPPPVASTPVAGDDAQTTPVNDGGQAPVPPTPATATDNGNAATVVEGAEVTNGDVPEGAAVTSNDTPASADAATNGAASAPVSDLAVVNGADPEATPVTTSAQTDTPTTAPVLATGTETELPNYDE